MEDLVDKDPLCMLKVKNNLCSHARPSILCHSERNVPPYTFLEQQERMLQYKCQFNSLHQACENQI